jgi:Family of unknown function (DUF5808)
MRAPSKATGSGRAGARSGEPRPAIFRSRPPQPKLRLPVEGGSTVSCDEHRALAITTEPKRKSGRFLGIPYNWDKPTWQRIRTRLWNPEEPRLFVPKAFGWGYTINLARLFGRPPKSG